MLRLGLKDYDMRIHIIACRVFTRELSYYASQSPHAVDITWLPQGLHDTPDKLRQMLKETLDTLSLQWEQGIIKHRPDYIVLGYGLCSNGVLGLESRDIPLVVPRTDDCIAIFLGSQKRYLALFEQHRGIYWLNTGWIESAMIPTEETYQKLYAGYLEKYGKDNADFLLAQEKQWIPRYSVCGYISSPVYDCPAYPRLAQEIAAGNRWRFCQFDGDDRIIRAMVEGTWLEEDFLVCPAGHRIEAAFDGTKIRAVCVA